MMHIVPTPVNGYRSLTTIACVAFFTVLIAACKKDEEKGITEKLMNKWSLVQILDTVYSSSAAGPVVTKYDGKSEDYLDFRKDGKLYRSINNSYDTANYTYSEANLKVDVKDFHYTMLILTDNTMILHEPHYGVSTGTYTAYKITLKR
jgi:hypothetical protein